jgi:hypothetical protein
MADAPDFAHFVPVLNPLVSPRSIGPAIATTLAPSLAAILVTCIALGVVHCTPSSAAFEGILLINFCRFRPFERSYIKLADTAYRIQGDVCGSCCGFRDLDDRTGCCALQPPIVGHWISRDNYYR